MNIQFTTTNYVATIVPFVLAFAIMPIAMWRAKLKQQGKWDIHRKKQVYNCYVFLNNNMLTRKKFRHIITSFSSLMCYDFEELQKECTTLFLKSVLTAILIPLFILVTVQSVFLTGIAALVGYMYYELNVERKIDKQVRKMSEEISFTIQSISDNYALTNDVARAVKAANRDACLAKPMAKIYDMLVAEDSIKELYEFKKSTPIRLLGTLATTCCITKEEGDVRDANGQLKFISKMTQMRLEADSKVRNLMATDLAFQSLSTLSLTGLVAAPIMDIFLLQTIPGTSIYLQGLYGYFEKAIMMICTILAYYIISTLRRPTVVNQVDRVEWIDRLSKHKTIKRFVETLIPKTYKEQRKWMLRMNSALSSKNLLYIYTAKVVTAVMCMVLVFIMCIAFTNTAKKRLWNNYDSLSVINSTAEMTEEMYYQKKQVDKQYMTSETKMEDTEAANLVKAKITGLSPLEVESEVDRLSTKWDKYYAIKFHWWYMIIVYLGGVAGWFSQEVSLMFRKKLVTYEAAEDAMQLQSLMMTLQATQYDVRQCLFWLSQEATVHKMPLWYAYLEYGSDPELALIRLQDSMSLRDMKRLVAKLEKAMYDLSIEDAFSDIALDKQQSLQINEMLQEKMLESKKELARMFANAPLTLSITAGFVLPIFLLGLKQLLASFSQI